MGPLKRKYDIWREVYYSLTISLKQSYSLSLMKSWKGNMQHDSLLYCLKTLQPMLELKRYGINKMEAWHLHETIFYAQNFILSELQFKRYGTYLHNTVDVM